MVAINFDAAKYAAEKAEAEMRRSTPIWEWPEYAGKYTEDELNTLRREYDKFMETAPGAKSVLIGKVVTNPDEFLEHWRVYDMIVKDEAERLARINSEPKKRGRPAGTGVSSHPVVIAEKEANKQAYEAYYESCRDKKLFEAAVKTMVKRLLEMVGELFPTPEPPYKYVARILAEMEAEANAGK